ncbi:MAG: TIGR02453 family protein [Acidimicrobiia bacterium]
MAQSYFTPEVFRFLRELAENNDRAWWEENKDRYIEVIREPAKVFIEDFGSTLQEISEHFVADTRTNGGSLMRPYRDTRFSKDKTPMKTNVGIQFRHESGKDVHAPGFYLHLEPGACFAGVGMWRPHAKVARNIRDGIFEDPDGWRKATKLKSFTDTWDLSVEAEDSLKRVPKEYGGDFIYSDDVRMKSFIARSKLTQKAVTSASFDEELATRFDRASALNQFLCGAIGLPY